MASVTFKRNSAALAQILKSSDVQAMCHDVAEAIARDVRSQKPDAEVVVDDYTTDRAASSVTIKDVRGILWQVRDGVLTRAASATGAEVTAR